MLRIRDRVVKVFRLVDPEHRQIFSGFVWVSLFLLVGKTVAFAKETVLAWRLGVSDTIDAYTYLMNWYQWPMGLWFSILTAVLVPLTAQWRNRDRLGLSGFMGELFALTILASLGLGLVVYLLLFCLLGQGWTGLSHDSFLRAAAIFGPLSWVLPIGLTISLLSAWAMAGAGYRNTLLESLPAAVILVTMLLPSQWVNEPLVWGTLAGMVCQFGALILTLRTQSVLQWPIWQHRSPLWRVFWSSIGFLAVGQALMGLTTLVDQQFASGLGTGAIATLSYANRVTSIFLSMGALAIGRAVLPVFSSMAAQEDRHVAVMPLAHRLGLICFSVGMILLVLGWGTAESVIRCVFERGAFRAEDSQQVSLVYKFALIQLPFYFMGMVYFSANASLGKHQRNAVSMVLSTISKIGLNVVLVPIWGLVGISIATAGMYAVFLLVLVHRTSGE